MTTAYAELIERLRASVTPMDVKQGLFTEHYVTPIPICLEAADALAALTRDVLACVDVANRTVDVEAAVALATRLSRTDDTK